MSEQRFGTRQDIRIAILEFVLHNGTVTWERLFDHLKDKRLLFNSNTFSFHLKQMRDKELLIITNMGNNITWIGIGKL